MRISDWSSDVCSSDLIQARGVGTGGYGPEVDRRAAHPDGPLGLPAPHVVMIAHDPCAGLQLLDQPWFQLQVDVGIEKQRDDRGVRSEEHTSELQSLMRISYAVFCLKKKKKNNHIT